MIIARPQQDTPASGLRGSPRIVVKPSKRLGFIGHGNTRRDSPSWQEQAVMQRSVPQRRREKPWPICCRSWLRRHRPPRWCRSRQLLACRHLCGIPYTATVPCTWLPRRPWLTTKNAFAARLGRGIGWFRPLTAIPMRLSVVPPGSRPDTSSRTRTCCTTRCCRLMHGGLGCSEACDMSSLMKPTDIAGSSGHTWPRLFAGCAGFVGCMAQIRYSCFLAQPRRTPPKPGPACSV